MIYYTDGACKGNPGRGGWGFVLLYQNCKQYSDWGGEKFTTNNRMELTAIIKALEYAKLIGDTDVQIFSDSKLCIDTCSNWIFGWRAKGLIEKRKNPDLLMQVLPLLYEMKPTFTWVKGHSGDTWNEYADVLSNQYCS